jgi:hypothetical protein
MTRSPVRRALYALAFASAMPLFLLGCPKKPVPAQEDAAPAATSSEPTLALAPDVDAGDDVDAADAGKKYSGPGINPNEAKMRQCCAAIAAMGKQLGSSPEAFQVNAAAQQCYVVAKQFGASGTAPEFAAVRAMLAGKTIPGSCAGL